MAKKKLSFEEALKRIEEITLSLENEGVALEQSIDLYKEGMELLALCKDKLDTAEKEVTVLTKSYNEIKEEPFESPEE